MALTIIAVGKKMPAWITTGVEAYRKRLQGDWALNLVEINAEKRTKSADLSRLIEREGSAMVAAIPSGSCVVCLDERGKLWPTAELADRLQAWQESFPQITFLIGGADGLAPTCLASADHRWSLSPLTLPHPLVRVLLVEQLYRAWSILNHHPYHRAG